MSTNNSQNSQYANNADGFTLGGGTTTRSLTVTGGNVTVTGAGSNTYTMPSASDTLVGRASTDVLTNKDLTSSTNSFPGTTLGYAQITSMFSTSSTSFVQVTGLTTTVTVPSGGRKVKITAFSKSMYNTSSGAYSEMSIWDGTVGSGTQISDCTLLTAAANQEVPNSCIAVVTPSAGSKTYNVGLKASAGTAAITAATTNPAFILVELI